MNIQPQSKDLDRLLQRLKPLDEDLARSYLTGAVGDEILPQLPRQEYPRSYFAYESRSIMDHWVGKNRDRAELLLKYCYAVGGSTMGNLYPYGVLGEVDGMDLHTWLTKCLGEPAAIAVRAAFECLSLLDVKMDWLWKLLGDRPWMVEEAYRLASPNDGKMRTFLATAMLSSGCPLSNRQQYLEQLVRYNLDALPESMYRAFPDQRAAVKAYLQRGDAQEPLPELRAGQNLRDLQDVLHGNHPEVGNLSYLLGAASLAAAERPEAICALRLYLTYNLRITLEGILDLLHPTYLRRMFPRLLKETPFGASAVLLFLSMRVNQRAEHRRRWALLCVEGLKDAYEHASFDERTALQHMLPVECKALGRNVEDDIISFLVKQAHSGGPEIEVFLRSKGSLANVQRELAEASGDCYFLGQVMVELRDYRLAAGWDDFACRALVVASHVYKNHHCASMIFDGRDFNEEQLAAACEALLQKELPMGRVLDLLGILHDKFYFDEEKRGVWTYTEGLIHREEHRRSLQDAVTNGSIYTRRAAVRALDGLDDKSLLAACADSSKQVKELLLEILPRHPEWAEDYAQMLNAKKAAQRLMAVEVLSRLGRRDLLESALAGEKNAKVADTIRTRLGAEAPTLEGASVQDLAQRILKGNKIRKLSWLTEKPLPTLYMEDGSPVSQDIRNAILLSCSELGRIGRSDTAAELARGIRNLPELAVEVFEAWMGEKAPAKHKWVLAFSAVFGGAAMTARLVRAINDWPNNARGAIACDAVFALALSDDPAALVTVDAISRRFKFRQVKVAAAQALENAARELGITTEELADRIVPTLGFGADGTKVFDYGKRSFTVRLTPTLELAITNDQGKAVKNLPAPGKTDEEQAAAAYEEFKAMKKQIKTTVTAQRSRLEAALSGSRCWEADRWRALFVGNPIMHQFAMSLIWGLYEDGKLTDTFRYMEDGSFNTVDEEEYRLPETGLIGLVHPVELDADTLDAWKQQLEDYEITQAIDQLGRPVYTMDDLAADTTKLEQLGGKVLNGLSLSGKLLGMGWYRGSVVDGGIFYEYYREDPGPNLAVELRFSGSPVGDENDDVTLFDAVFYRPGTVRRGSYIYDPIQPENMLPLSQIPARYYSEIIHQLTKATASSTETDSDWRDKAYQ